MSGCLSQSFYNIMNMKNNIVNNEEHHSPNLLEKQSIVSIKRTFSADMSSEKWLENNEFSLKRVKSSEHLQSLEEENDQNNEEIKEGSGGAAFEDIWSSILTQKKSDGAVSADTADTAPYVHPLVRRASSLSEKSLEICTESLGSETGSDGFSSPLSDRGEEQEKEVCEEVEEAKNDDVVVVEVVKYNFPINNNKKVSVGAPRSFPPPLPSLAHRDDGSNLHMRTRRQDGRLVLEAVSVPSKSCLQACRQGGRLLLTLTDEEEKEQDEDENDKEEEKEAAFQVDETLVLPQKTTRVIDVTRRSSSAVTMTKLIELVSTRNTSTWPRMSNMTFVRSFDEVGEEDEKKGLVEVESARLKTVGKSLLPPRPKMSTATAAADTVLNAYEYYWRRSNSSTATAVAVLKPLAGKQNNNFSDSVSPQVVNDGTKGMKMFLLGNNGKRIPQEEIVQFGSGEAGEKAENLVPLFRGCKDRRKSLFFFKPYCVATS